MKRSTNLLTHIVSGILRGRFACLLVIATAAAACFAQSSSIKPYLPTPVRMVSTIAPNGDVNPYGVAFVPNGFPAGTLQAGDILVSNFNNAENLQGTGTTIVHIPQNGAPSVFYESSYPHTGLSNALNVLKSGFVLVGSLPTLDGTCATVSAGSILLLNGGGQLEGAINTGISGPWGMTVNDEGNKVQAFVANGLNGSITRLDLKMSHGQVSVASPVEIATGYQHQCDPAALLDAPSGLVYDASSDTLYVASTLDNAVFAVSGAGHSTGGQGTGTVVYQDSVHLHGALAMAQTPSGHLVVTNNDVINSDPNQPSEIVEFTKQGQFVKEVSVDTNMGGSFGLQTRIFGNIGSQLAAVDDNTSSLIIRTLP